MNWTDTRAKLIEVGLSPDLPLEWQPGIDLRGASLRWADLCRADLRWADLSRAYLESTVLDNTLLSKQRAFCRACPPVGRHGGRIVYRTRHSQHIDNCCEYQPGYTYTAPHLSFSVETACHPGIYAAGLEWMQEEYPNTDLVRCYVRDGDWIITAKGAIRCKKIRVLSTA